MTFPFRLLIYVAVLAGGLAVGRYLVPSKDAMVEAGKTAQIHRDTLRKFWAAQYAASQEGREGLAPKLESFAPLLGRLTAEDFPALATEVRDQEAASYPFAARWAEVDPGGFFNYLAARGMKTLRDHQWAGILIHGWAQKDVKSAEAASSRLRVPGAPVDPLKAVAMSILPYDIQEGIKFLADRSLGLSPNQMLAILKVDAPQDPRWKGADVDAKIEYLQSLPESEWQEAALTKLYGGLIAENPESVLKTAQQTGRGTALIPAAVDQWIAKDANAVTAYFQNSAKDQVRAAIGVALAKRAAAQDPQGTWDFALWYLSGPPRVEALRAVLDAMAMNAPAQAAQQIAELPDAPLRRGAMGDLARQWLARDPVAAEQWIKSLDVHDRATVGMALLEDPKLTPEQAEALKQKYGLGD